MMRPRQTRQKSMAQRPVARLASVHSSAWRGWAGASGATVWAAVDHNMAIDPGDAWDNYDVFLMNVDNDHDCSIDPGILCFFK